MEINQVDNSPNLNEGKSIWCMPNVSIILQASSLDGGEFYVLSSNTWEMSNLGFLTPMVLVDGEGPNALINTLLSVIKKWRY